MTQFCIILPSLCAQINPGFQRILDLIARRGAAFAVGNMSPSKNLHSRVNGVEQEFAKAILS
jgi:hypothetical protein